MHHYLEILKSVTTHLSFLFDIQGLSCIKAVDCHLEVYYIISIVLSLKEAEVFKFSLGSLFVILTTCCWELKENNCTRMISNSTYEIVILKGIFSGTVHLIAIYLGRGYLI